MAKKTGRPTKYRKHMDDTCFNILARGGMVAQVCRELGIAKETFYGWTRKHKSFLDSYKKGVIAGEAVVGSRIYAAAFDPANNPVNNGMVALIMANCFGWRSAHDKTKDDEKEAGEIEEVVYKIVKAK